MFKNCAWVPHTDTDDDKKAIFFFTSQTSIFQCGNKAIFSLLFKWFLNQHQVDDAKKEDELASCLFSTFGRKYYYNLREKGLKVSLFKKSLEMHRKTESLRSEIQKRCWKGGALHLNRFCPLVWTFKERVSKSTYFFCRKKPYLYKVWISYLKEHFLFQFSPQKKMMTD